MFNSNLQYKSIRRFVAYAVILVLITVVTGACTRTPQPKVDSTGSIQTVSFDSARSFQTDAAYWNAHGCQGQWISLSYTDNTCATIAANFDYCWANQSDSSVYCQDFVK